MSAADAILIAHAAATAAMAGLIWFVQVVHYPLFLRIGSAEFPAWEREHVARTGRLVAPLMILEAASALALLVHPPPGAGAVPAIGLALLAALWLTTFLVQVPLHRRLERGRDDAAIRRLVRTNWPRTLLWTLRAVLALWLLRSA